MSKVRNGFHSSYTPVEGIMKERQNHDESLCNT